MLPHPPRDSAELPDRVRQGRASWSTRSYVSRVPEGRLILQTVRSHDQYNTTIYGLDDRYRGIHNGRRVVFVNPDDLAALGIADGTMVDIVSEWTDGIRAARVGDSGSCPTRRRAAARRPTSPRPTCWCRWSRRPTESNTPSSKQMIVRLEHGQLRVLAGSRARPVAGRPSPQRP